MRHAKNGFFPSAADLTDTDWLDISIKIDTVYNYFSIINKHFQFSRLKSETAGKINLWLLCKHITPISWHTVSADTSTADRSADTQQQLFPRCNNWQLCGNLQLLCCLIQYLQLYNSLLVSHYLNIVAVKLVTCYSASLCCQEENTYTHIHTHRKSSGLFPRYALSSRSPYESYYFTL